VQVLCCLGARGKSGARVQQARSTVLREPVQSARVKGKRGARLRRGTKMREVRAEDYGSVEGTVRGRQANLRGTWRSRSE